MDPKYFDGQLDYWRMYRLPQVAAFFATAATNYSCGEFAMNCESWGPEAAMLKNLKMNFTAIYYGDQLFDHMYSKYARQENFFIYLWTPLEVSGYFIYATTCMEVNVLFHIFLESKIIISCLTGLWLQTFAESFKVRGWIIKMFQQPLH